MKLLSPQLVSHDYRTQLQGDLARAKVCRFLVAYVSTGGLRAIEYGRLGPTLEDPRSFGVSSLSCSCGFEPLMELQDELGGSEKVRLKYFMDPLEAEPGEPKGIGLFHSKLVYLYLPREKKSVIYLGSHNWTRRALGPGRPRNAEASLRVEEDFVPEDLEGTGSTFASQVNRHLLEAFALPACLPATAANRAVFEQWSVTAGCRRAPGFPMDNVTVLVSVRKDDGTIVPPAQWETLHGRGIYFQALEEQEGQRVWQSGDGLLVLVWKSEADLRAGNQPIILRCRITTNKAGPQSQLQGTNLATAAVAGFQAVVFDEKQLAAMQSAPAASRSSVTIWSGRPVELYDFEFPTKRSDSSQVDGRVTPKYQFHLEVEHIVFPADEDRPEGAEFVWARDSFAVANSKDDAKVEEVLGYVVTPRLEQEIRSCLVETLLVDLERAKVLPVSEYDQAKVGKRVSGHPLHETFIGPEAIRARDDFYRKAGPELLTADLDAVLSQESSEDSNSVAPVHRVERVFTMQFEKLRAAWAETARQFKSRKR
jgi:hypothetical protein